jgi:hypothetical protein
MSVGVARAPALAAVVIGKEQPYRRESSVREVPVTEAGSIEGEVYKEIASALRTQRTLGDVLAWGRRQSPPRSVTEIITQDEYTHDVIVALDDRHYLIFDTT